MTSTQTSPTLAHRHANPSYQEALTLFGVSPADYSWTDTARKIFDHKGKGGHDKGGGKKATHYPKDKNLPAFKCRFMSQSEYTAIKKYLKKQGLI